MALPRGIQPQVPSRDQAYGRETDPDSAVRAALLTSSDQDYVRERERVRTALLASSDQAYGHEREPDNATEIRTAIREAMEALKAKARAEGGDEPTPEELANAGARAAQAFFNRE